MNQIYKYKKVYYGKQKTPILVTRNTSKFNEIIDNRIILPIASSDSELIFTFNEKEYTLLEYILEKQRLSMKEIVNLIILIGDLFSYFNNKNYIVGSIDLEDIIFNPKDKKQLVLRQTRNLFELEKLSYDMDYCNGLYTTTQVKYGNYIELDMSTDVELLGKIFIKLTTGRDVSSYEELRYIGYHTRLFRNDIPVELQQFINKSTSINPTERYKSVTEAIQDLKRIYVYTNKKEYEQKSLEDIITYSCICDAGKSKLDKQETRCVYEQANQDKCGIYEKNKAIFAFVADGVSNCTYGSGYKSSQIVQQVCEEASQKNLGSINTREDAKEFLEHIVKTSNDRIVEYVNRNYHTLENDNIMSTTFLGIIIINNKLYIISIGDSRAYIINKDEDISYTLTIDENYGNENLGKNITWEQYENLSKKSSLTNVIGNIDSNINIKFNEFTITKGNVILLCSDGLTNYIADLIDLNDDWKRQEKLTQIITDGMNNNHNVSRINFDLVERANENGGLDNISSILIQV